MQALTAAVIDFALMLAGGIVALGAMTGGVLLIAAMVIDSRPDDAPLLSLLTGEPVVCNAPPVAEWLSESLAEWPGPELDDEIIARQIRVARLVNGRVG